MNQNTEYTESIYHYSDKIAKERLLIQNHKTITNRNKDLILQFCRERQIKKGFSNGRILKLLNKLKLIAVVLNIDFDKAKKEDIDKFLEFVNNKERISKATKVDYLIILKIFYKWLLCSDKKYPEIVEDIKTTIKRKERLPSEILDETDINKMINSANNLRDRAIISLLSDSGARVGELINLRLRNIKFNHQDNTINLLIESGKSGGRRLILIPSVPYISNYINSLPEHIKSDENNFLFVKLNKNEYINEQMTYISMRALLNHTAKRAGVKKSINPHAFRRHSATNSSSFMSDTMLMQRYGWRKRNTVDSYTFMNPTVADEAYMNKYGRKTVEIKESKLIPIKCSCGNFNPLDSMCSNCGKPNSLKVVIQIQEEKEKKDQEALILIKKAIEIIAKNLNDETKEELKKVLV